MFTVVPKDKFKKQGRDKLLAYQKYSRRASDIIRRRDWMSSNLSDPEFRRSTSAPQLLTMSNFRTDLIVEYLALSYSAGAEVAELRAIYPAALDCFEHLAESALTWERDPTYTNSKVANLPLAGSGYPDANLMVCFAILLGWGQSLPRLARVIDFNNPSMDAMLERLMAPYVPDRAAPPSTCTRGLPYSKVIPIFDEPPAARSELMSEYLDSWYSASRREPYYDSHKRDAGFTGYWAWESGAIVYLQNIDDAAFRNARFYPQDLVDFARQHGTLSSDRGNAYV